MKREHNTAIHEAGHFIAYLLYVSSSESWPGMECEALSIVPDETEGSRGHLKYGKTFAGEILSAGSMREELAKVWLAGYAADMIRKGKTDAKRYLTERLANEAHIKDSDADCVVEMFLYQTPEDGHIEDTAAPYFEDVCNDLQMYWPVVLAVADELLKQKYIEGEALNSLAYIAANKLGIDIDPDDAPPVRISIPPGRGHCGQWGCNDGQIVKKTRSAWSLPTGTSAAGHRQTEGKRPGQNHPCKTLKINEIIFKK